MATYRILPPAPPRRQRFGMTPLADAMFQLLIFFMLSSNLTPYSLLSLQQRAPVTQDPAQIVGGEGTSVAHTAPSNSNGAAVWTVEPDAVLVSGQRFEFSQLAALADTLGAEDVAASVVLVVRASARVQDVATVLERLRAANVWSTQISAEGL